MYRKILAPLDGSELSECALNHVRIVARGCSVPEVVLLYVVQPFLPTAMEYTSVSVMVEEETRMEEWGKNYLAKVAEGLKSEGVNARGVVLRGNAASVILDYAAKNDIDIIIMSTHGRSGPARWVFGSVADRVSRHSSIPVLVVSPPGCRKAIEGA